MKRESLPLLGVCKTLFPFLQRLSINPLSQCYAVLNTGSPIAHGSGCVWFVTIEVVIFSSLSGLIEHCSVEQWHMKIWVHLALSNHLASEMGHRVTKPQGRLWRPSGRKKNPSARIGLCCEPELRLLSLSEALFPNLAISSLKGSTCMKATAEQGDWCSDIRKASRSSNFPLFLRLHFNYWQADSQHWMVMTAESPNAQRHSVVGG